MPALSRCCVHQTGTVALENKSDRSLRSRPSTTIGPPFRCESDGPFRCPLTGYELSRLHINAGDVMLDDGFFINLLIELNASAQVRAPKKGLAENTYDDPSNRRR